MDHDTLTTLGTVLGNLSFALSALSFLMRSMFWLRLIALVSLVCGLTYNVILLTTVPEIVTVVRWQALFLAINLGQLAALVWRASEVSLPEQHRALLALVWPTMRTRDFRSLAAAATVRTLRNGEHLVNVGDELHEVFLVTAGTLAQRFENGALVQVESGQFIGDASYVVGNQYGGSPSAITAAGDVELWVWRYATLAKLSRDNVLALALADGFTRAMVKGRRLLRRAGGPAPHTREVELHADARAAHARTFTTMTTAQVARLFELGNVELHSAGAAMDNATRVGVVLEGCLRVTRSDGQYIDLVPGSFVGEIAWVAKTKVKVQVELHARGETRVLWWPHPVLAQCRTAEPVLYAALVEAVAKNMAVKLALPLVPLEGSAPEGRYVAGGSQP